jgi:hypothetical protein
MSTTADKVSSVTVLVKNAVYRAHPKTVFVVVYYNKVYSEQN